MHRYRPQCTATPSTEMLFLDGSALGLFDDEFLDQIVGIADGDFVGVAA